MGDEEETGAARSGRRLMLFAILSLIIVVILMVVLHLYTRLRLSHRMRRRDDRRIRQQIVAVESLNFTLVEEPPKRGLDPSVVASLPTFSYKLDSASDSEPIECSVCLGSVVEGSTVKELPNCKHLFHVECIDLWLGGSTNCPNCRAAVEVVVGGGTAAQASAPPIEQEVVDAGGGQVEKGRVSGSSRLDSFRRILAVGERSARHGRGSGGDEFPGGQDVERQ